MNRRFAQRGYTLVELLVVIAIIGILTSITVPAVISALENARRVQCQNRMRQLGVALQVHEVRKQSYPGYLQHYGDFDGSGGLVPAHAKVGTWAVALLKDLERQDVAEVWSDDQVSLLSLDTQHQIPGTLYDARKMPNLNVMACPSDTNNGQETNAMNSYCAAAGMWPGGGVSFANAMRSANGIFVNRFTPSDSAVVQAAHLPPYLDFPKPRATRADRVRDSKALTVAFTENLQAEPWYRVSLGDGSELLPGNVESQIDPNTSRLLTGVVWQWFDGNGTAGAPVPPRQVRINGGDPINQSMRTSGVALQDLARPSSNHPGGVNMAFLDTHVQFVSEFIDYQVYQSLMTPETSRSDVPDPRHVISESEL